MISIRLVTPDGVPQFQEIKQLVCPTPEASAIEKVVEFRGLSNRIPTDANENPGALAGATGAELHTIGIVSIEYRNRAEAAISLCLSIGNCDPQDACEIMEAALLDLGAGQLQPPLFSVMDAAADWAEWASVTELKAYALACYHRMRAADRVAFLAFVGRVA